MTPLAAIVALALAVAPGTLRTSTLADRTTLGLSDSVAVTLMLEGPAPLRIEPPASWLTDESASIWKIGRMEPAKVEPLPGGRERWTLRLVVDPFLPGDAVPLQFSSAMVTAGSEVAPQTITWDGLELRVLSSVDLKTAKPRPITGLEVPPHPPATNESGDPTRRIVAAFAPLLLACVMLLLARRRRHRKAESPTEWMLRELDLLAGTSESEDPTATLDRVLALGRAYLEREFTIPATKLTATEFALAAASFPLPEAEGWQRFFETNDASRYAGPQLTRDSVRNAIEDARRLVAASHRLL